MKVKPPRDRDATETMKYLSAGEAELLFRAVPSGENGLKVLRDRAMIVLMTLEGLRRVEIHRANVADLEHLGDAAESRILVHGKGKDAYIYHRPDTLSVIDKYLRARGPVDKDDQGTSIRLDC